MGKTILLILFLLSLLLFSSSLIPEKLIENPSILFSHNNASESKVILKEVMSIGVLEGDSNLMFHNPYGVAVDGEGNIYVLDGGNFRIQKFDKKGKYLLSIGRKGQGPGEFLNCFDFDLDEKGNIVLFDSQNSRVSKFSPDGKYSDSIKLGFPARQGTVDSDGNIYLYAQHKGKLIHKYDSNGKFIVSFMDEIKFEPKRIEPHINNLGQISTFKKKLYLTMVYPYSLHVFDRSGKRLDRIEVNVSHAKLPFIAPDNTVFTRFLFTGLSVSLEGYIFNKGISFEVPKDWQNKIQEIVQNIYDYSFIDVFDGKTNYVSHLKCPGFTWGGTFDSQGYYFVIKEDEEGFFKVVKYAIRIDPGK
jgi:DNA-binding beta-propeller fold protein YncE